MMRISSLVCLIVFAEWTASQQEVDEELWEQDWDDDVGALDDAFSRRLKAELNGMQTS